MRGTCLIHVRNRFRTGTTSLLHYKKHSFFFHLVQIHPVMSTAVRLPVSFVGSSSASIASLFSVIACTSTSQPAHPLKAKADQIKQRIQHDWSRFSVSSKENPPFRCGTYWIDSLFDPSNENNGLRFTIINKSIDQCRQLLKEKTKYYTMNCLTKLKTLEHSVINMKKQRDKSDERTRKTLQLKLSRLQNKIYYYEELAGQCTALNALFE